MRTYYHTPTGRIGIPAADLRHVRRHANGTFEDVSRQHPFWALTQPGVTFTPEQDAQIRAFVAANRLQEAQRIILDELAKR